MYVALPVGTAADKCREGKKSPDSKIWSEYSAAEACPHARTHTHTCVHSLYEEVNACASGNECFMNTFDNCLFFCISIRSRVFNYRFKIETFTRPRAHTHIFPGSTSVCSFFCRLIPKWHFLWSPNEVSSQTGLLSLLLLSCLLCVSVCLYVHSQWNNGSFQLRRTEFVRF